MLPLPFRPSAVASLALAAMLLLPSSAFAAKDQVPDWVKAAMAEPVTGVSDNAKAVVLLDETTLKVGPDGQAVEHRRRVVKILRPTGREEGVVFVPFDNDTKILSLHIWSVGPDGQEYAVKDKEILEIGEPNSGPLYSDERYKLCEPPGRDPGGVIAYEYEQRKAYYEHEQDWFIQSSIPRMHQSLTLELPPGYSYAAVWAHHETEKATDLEHQRTRWDLAATPAIDLERVPFAPPMGGLTGRMTVHYGPTPTGKPALGTWQEVSDVYDQIARDRMTATPEIAAKAVELTAGKTDFYAKAEAVAEFVQKDIRYFVIEKGIGGWQPHPAADIFRNRYGDCKDKSTLLSAMLSSIVRHPLHHRAGRHATAASSTPSCTLDARQPRHRRHRNSHRATTSPKLRSVVTAKVRQALPHRRSHLGQDRVRPARRQSSRRLRHPGRNRKR